MKKMMMILALLFAMVGSSFGAGNQITTAYTGVIKTVSARKHPSTGKKTIALTMEDDDYILFDEGCEIFNEWLAMALSARAGKYSCDFHFISDELSNFYIGK